MLTKIPPTEIQAILDEIITMFLVPRFMALGMDATGKWINSLEAKDNKIYGQHYTAQLVFGRQPGKMPPPKAIEEWVNAKLRIYGPEAVSMSWAIAKKIAAEGTSWYQKGGSNLLEVLEEPAVTNYIFEKVGSWYKVRIAQELLRETKTAFA